MRHISLAYDMSTFWNGSFNLPAKTHTRASADTYTVTLVAIRSNDVILLIPCLLLLTLFVRWEGV